MGKSVAKSAGASVPMVLGGIELIEPTHFDGWGNDDLTEWLITASPQAEQAEHKVEAMKAGVGLAVWMLRQGTDDGQYGGLLRVIAQRSGVSVRTLGRWREAAEARYELAVSKRTTGQKLRHRVPTLDAPQPEQSESAPPVPPSGEGEPAPTGLGSPARRQPVGPGKAHMPAPSAEAVKVNNGCGHVPARRDGADCLDCGATVGRLATPAEAPGETVEKCIRCQNCPRCGGTGVLVQRERKPFGR